jgi:tricorn protease
VWSPDSKTIAFSANRFGHMNVYVVAAEGGEARRLTWYSADERPSSFAPDGKAVLFASPRLGSATATFARPHTNEHSNQLYQVPVEGGRETFVLPNAALDARWDAKGQFMLYTSASIEQQFRKHQTSSAARQVWLYDARSGVHASHRGGAREPRCSMVAAGRGVLSRRGIRLIERLALVA